MSRNKWSSKVFSKYISLFKCGITNENGWIKAYLPFNIGVCLWELCWVTLTHMLVLALDS